MDTVENLSLRAGSFLEGQRSIRFIGPHTLGFQLADQFGLIAEDILERGHHIATGGAIGADQVTEPLFFRPVRHTQKVRHFQA